MPKKASFEGSHPGAKRTAQCPYLTRTDVRYHHRSEPVPNFPKKATFLIRQPAQHRPKVVQKACFSLINPQEQHRPPGFFVCMVPLPYHTPTLKSRARSYVPFLSSRIFLLAPPADYLKGRADRRVVERVLGIWGIRVTAEDARGTPRPSFERGWVGASKSLNSLKVVRWGCR